MINKSFFYSLIFVCALMFLLSPNSEAQNRAALDEEVQQDEQPKKLNLLREFNLTADQIQQIRKINQERKISRPAAQSRLKTANEALDAAIYGEGSEAEVQARLRDVHAAQLEVLKNRVAYERNLKLVLTPQQFTRFRELRQQYNQARKRNLSNGGDLNQNPNITPAARRQRRNQRLQNGQKRLNQ